MRVVVTGAAGMIGSNLVHGLNAIGIDDVIAVDDLTDGPKYRNLLGAQISDYFDKDDFYTRFAAGEFGRVDAVLHQGACSDTMEHDGRYMLDTNYRCSKTLLDACQAQGVRLLYASSAATYGGSSSFRETPEFEQPLNVYGYSKLLFDNVVRRMLPSATSQVAGFRYFNVYGPREQHKGRMASVAFHHFNQLRDTGHVKLFGDYGGYGPGQQSRDFVFVGDVVKVNLWFLEHPEVSGIYNLGTGKAQPFNDVAVATVNTARAARGETALSLDEMVQAGTVQYIDFPAALVGKYQCFTEADIARLRAVGYPHEFANVGTGWPATEGGWRRSPEVHWLHGRQSRRPRNHRGPIMFMQRLARLLAVSIAFCSAAVFAAVDINKADQASLESVKGIGPAMSTRMLDERKKSPFKDWPDLIDRVKGVGPGNASRFSEGGLTVNGATYAKGEGAAKAEAKPADTKTAKK